MANLNNQNRHNSDDLDTIGVQNHYQCSHCNAFFIPRKRFIQKYCSDSCRVMAWRDRNNGVFNDLTPNLRGNLTSQPPKTQHVQQNQEATTQNAPGFDEVIKYFEKRDLNLQKKIDEIKNQQTLHIWISALAPILGEPIREILTNLFKGNQIPQNLDQLLMQIDKKTMNLSPELKQKVMNTVTEHWNDSHQVSGNTERVVLPKPGGSKTIL